MTTTAFSGPVVVFGSMTGPGEYNPDRGPSMFDEGAILMDPRDTLRYLPGQRAGQPNFGWSMATMIQGISDVPPTLTVAAIVASAVPVAGTPMTLVSVNGAGIVVAQSLVRTDTGATVTGLLAVEIAVTPITFGQGPTGSGGSVNAWDPTTMLSRTVRIVSVGNDSTATFTIRGYDIYKYPMQETITGANAGTATGLKAFKYIASVTPAGTLSGSAVTVGTTDVIGLPLYSSNIGEILVYWNSLVALPTFVAGVTTSPATATTGDVRGTFVLPTASDATKRLQLFQTPNPANLKTTALQIGVTQFADF